MYDGSEVVSDPRSISPRKVNVRDLDHLAFVREVFLPQARARGLIERDEAVALSSYAWELGASLAPVPDGAEPAATRPAQAPVPGATAHPAPVRPASAAPKPATAAGHVPARVSTPVAASKPVEPGPFARWWERARSEVGSDLATHGLAYLGVLLLFVGVFGFVAFAFGDVAQTARPIAELVIAIAPFAAASLLLRRGAVIAGRALELAGGLLLPVMIVTSFLDGVPYPPDLLTIPLVIALTLATAVVAAGYALWCARHHESALRFLVAPVAWLAVAFATMWIGREIPSGKAVASVTPAQATAISVAILVTLLLVRARPTAHLSDPSRVSSVVGIIVVAPLAIASWAASGWPVWPIVVTGIATIAVVELVVPPLQRALSATVEPLWWAAVALSLVPGLGQAPAAAVGLLGFLVLVELDGRRSLSRPLALSVVALAVSTTALFIEPWWAFAGTLLLAGWAGARRLRPFVVPGLVASATALLDLAAGALPVAAVVAFGLATHHAALTALVAAILVCIATIPATRPESVLLLRRDAQDHFWLLWWDAGFLSVVAALGLIDSAY